MWPRIEKDNITAIKIIGTTLTKSSLPYAIFVKLTWTFFSFSYFNFLPYAIFVKLTWTFFSFSDFNFTFENWYCFSLSEPRMSSYILCAKDEKPSLKNRTVKSLYPLPFKNWHISKKMSFISNFKQQIYNRRRDLVFLLVNFSCKVL